MEKDTGKENAAGRDKPKLHDYASSARGVSAPKPFLRGNRNQNSFCSRANLPLPIGPRTAVPVDFSKMITDKTVEIRNVG